MNLRPRFQGLRTLMLVALLGVALLALGPAWAILPGQARADAENLLAARLQAEARLIAHEAGPLLAAGSAAAVADLAARSAEAAGVRVAVVGGSAGEAATPEVLEALTGRPGRDLRRDAQLGETALFVAVPIEAEGRILGAVQVIYPAAEVERAAEGVRSTLSISLAVALAAAASLALVMAGRIARPALALTRAADDVAAGHYEHEVVVAGPREISQLGEAFGRMAKALDRSFASLEAERDRVDAVLRHMADGIIIADGEGVVTLANPAAGRILGIHPRRAIGQRLAAIVREHEITDVARRCIAGSGLQREYTTTVERASPRRYLRAVATRVGDGRDVQVLLVLQDLTELRRLETVRREFLANVSHELRTPIASIKAMVETLEDGAIDDPPAARDFLARMHRETDGLAHLVEELLQLSRIESGQAALRFEAVQVADLVGRVVERLSPLVERAGLSLETGIEADLPAVRADRERIAQVLMNMVHNAVKFTPPGGTVVVSARRDEQGVAFAVADSGVGIAEEDLPRLFERFYKVDKARASGGTGLGLAIAKHLVQAHGGRIWAESPGPGQGATFSFALPAA